MIGRPVTHLREGENVRAGTLEHFARACAAGVVLVAFLGASGAAEAAKKRDYGPAPAGCYYGPRGGLHCTRVVRAPGEETAAQRERRLLRECKGRPNAGACLGYTR